MRLMGRVQIAKTAVSMTCCCRAGAGNAQLVSPADPESGGGASAGGDSYLPIMTPVYLCDLQTQQRLGCVRN